MNNVETVTQLVISADAWFSSVSIQKKYGLGHLEADQVCVAVALTGIFTKCYELDCPKCNGSTGIGGPYPKDIEDLWVYCDSCDFEGYRSEFVEKIYFSK